MQLNGFKDVPRVQIKTVSPKLNDLEELPTKDAEQLPTPKQPISAPVATTATSPNSMSQRHQIRRLNVIKFDVSTSPNTTS